MKGSVKRQMPDIKTAKATARDSRERMEMARAIAFSQKAKYLVENVYKSVHEFLDAILYLEGYKSYSHEASVAYIQGLGFSQTEIENVNRLRKLGNGIKYYGEDIAAEGADSAINTAEAILKKLRDKKPRLK